MTSQDQTSLSSGKKPRYLWPRKFDVAIIFGLSTVYSVLLKIHQYYAFNVGFELADYETVLWNTLNGRFLQMTCSDLAFFSEHFSPILLIISPIYYMLQSPLTLLVIQAIGFSIAVFPLFHLTARFTELRWPPAAMAMAYVFSRTVNYGLVYDFHPEILYPVLLFGVFLTFEKRQWVWYYVLIVLAVMVKEDAFIALIGLGLFVFARGEKKHGSITALGGLAALIIVLVVIIPMFRGQETGSDYKFIAYWTDYGSTQKEILLNFLNPVKHIEVVFSGDKAKQMFNLFSVFIFLPLFSWRSLLFLVLPNWFMLYSSSNTLLNGPLIYYGLLITPFLFYSALHGIGAVKSLLPRYGKVLPVLLYSLIFIVQLGNSRIHKQLFFEDYDIPDRYAVTFPEVASKIPPTASTSSQVYLVSHMPKHECRATFPAHLNDADYILLDTDGSTWPLSDSAYNAVVDTLLNSDTHKLLEARDGFLLFQTDKH